MAIMVMTSGTVSASSRGPASSGPADWPASRKLLAVPTAELRRGAGAWLPTCRNSDCASAAKPTPCRSRSGIRATGSVITAWPATPRAQPAAASAKVATGRPSRSLRRPHQAEVSRVAPQVTDCSTPTHNPARTGSRVCICSAKIGMRP